MPGQTPSAEEKPFSFQIFLSKPAAAGSLGLMRCAPRTGGDVGGEPRSAPRAFGERRAPRLRRLPRTPAFCFGGDPPARQLSVPHSLTHKASSSSRAASSQLSRCRSRKAAQRPLCAPRSKASGPGAASFSPGSVREPPAFFPRPPRLPTTGEAVGALPLRDRRARLAAARPMRPG